MSKDRRTVSLEPETNEYLSESGVNASELVNKLVKSHMSAGGNKRAMLELRREQVKDDIADLESRLESKKGRLENINKRLEDHQADTEKVLEEADTALDQDDIEERNQKVQFWADEIGEPIDSFLNKLEEYRSTQ